MNTGASPSLSVKTASCGGLARSSERQRLSGAGARPATTDVVALIDAYRDQFGVEPTCQVLEIAPSTYATKSRPTSARRTHLGPRGGALVSGGA